MEGPQRCLTCRKKYTELDLEYLAKVPVCFDCLVEFHHQLLARLKTIRLIPSALKKPDKAA